MVAVFAGFAQADLLPVKQLGVGLALAVFLDATVVRGVLVPAAMAVMGRGNWWWPRDSRQQHRAALPQEIATVMSEDSVSIRDEKQTVGASDGHAYCMCGADLGMVYMLVGLPRPAESSAGWKDDAASVKQTIFLERLGRIHEAADVRQSVVLERPGWRPAA